MLWIVQPILDVGPLVWVQTFRLVKVVHKAWLWVFWSAFRRLKKLRHLTLRSGICPKILYGNDWDRNHIQVLIQPFRWPCRFKMKTLLLNQIDVFRLIKFHDIKLFFVRFLLLIRLRNGLRVLIFLRALYSC